MRGESEYMQGASGCVQRGRGQVGGACRDMWVRREGQWGRVVHEGGRCVGGGHVGVRREVKVVGCR